MVPIALPSPELTAKLEALHQASFGWARSCCAGDPDEAADVLQSCYEKVLAGRAAFAGRSSFRTWLFGVIRLTAFEARRRQARATRLNAWDAPLPEPERADAALLEAEQVETLRVALATLPARQREVLHLVFYEGMSVAQSAEVMELSVGSARVHYDRGKKRLRALLTPALQDTDPDSREATA